MREEGPWDGIIKTLSADVANSRFPRPQSVVWDKHGIIFGHKVQQQSSAVSGMGRELRTLGTLQTLDSDNEERGMRTRERSQGSVLSHDRHQPNNILRKFSQCTTLVEGLKQLWDRSRTGMTMVSHSELVEERSLEVDLQKMIFRHREDQGIQFSRQFYSS